MNGLPYYKAYPRDFIEGTISMDFETKCAYRVVLDLIYMQAGNLPDDARYIAGLLGCSVRKWTNLREKLIDTGKIFVRGEFLANYRADNELIILAKLQDKQRENRSRPNKNNDLGSRRFDQPEPEPESEPDKSDGGDGKARESDPEILTVRERLLAAMGVGPEGVAGPSRFLGSQADMAEVARWLAMPAMSVEAVEAEIARLIAKKRDGPPASFKYFTGAMQRLSTALSAPPLEPAPVEERRSEQKPTRDRRIAAADDAFAERIAFAARNRSPTRSDFGFGGNDS